ncbi:MAG: alpha/beta fold hydrolase [Kineosporiaceae bacterium]
MTTSRDAVAALLADHERRGRRVTAGGLGSFALDEGAGETVVLVHGVPASSWLFRKVVPALAARGLRAVAPDLPGQGLADRPAPADFPYTYTAMGHWLGEALDVLGVGDAHLVVHDWGGPVGLEWAAAHPDRVRSLTVLNTMIAVDVFRRPWFMAPFAHPVAGPAWQAVTRGPVFREFLRRIAFRDRLPVAEIAAYEALMRRDDDGRAFRAIVTRLERTAEKAALYQDVVRDDRRPVQVVWGVDDPALTLATEGAIARALRADSPFHRLRGRHFFPDDQSAALAPLIARFVAATPTGPRTTGETVPLVE